MRKHTCTYEQLMAIPYYTPFQRAIAAHIGPKCYVEDHRHMFGGSVLRVMRESSGVPYGVEIDGARGRVVVHITDIDLYEPWGPENLVDAHVAMEYDPRWSEYEEDNV